MVLHRSPWILWALARCGAWGLVSQEPAEPGTDRAMGGQHPGQAGQSVGMPGPVLIQGVGYDGDWMAGLLHMWGPLSLRENLVIPLLSRKDVCLKREGEVGVGKVEPRQAWLLFSPQFMHLQVEGFQFLCFSITSPFANVVNIEMHTRPSRGPTVPFRFACQHRAFRGCQVKGLQPMPPKGPFQALDSSCQEHPQGPLLGAPLTRVQELCAPGGGRGSLIKARAIAQASMWLS